MTYQVAERFKAVQGEGVYAGTPMAFIRFVGCSVGKKICHHCDTDFDKTYPWKGGGEYTRGELFDWVGETRHICLTGGEPLNQDLFPFFRETWHIIHIETSGTVVPSPPIASYHWVTVSPKPGWRDEMIERADEIKVIVPGLGNDPTLFTVQAGQIVVESIPNNRWPTLQDALRWAGSGKIVFLQPRNAKHDIDQNNLHLCEELVREHPSLRLSVQLHKVLRSR